MKSHLNLVQLDGYKYYDTEKQKQRSLKKQKARGVWLCCLNNTTHIFITLFHSGVFLQHLNNIIKIILPNGLQYNVDRTKQRCKFMAYNTRSSHQPGYAHQYNTNGGQKGHR